MSKQYTGTAVASGPRGHEPDAINDSAHAVVCEDLRSSVRRLQRDLAERQAQARPLPSSVRRAYLLLIRRHYAALAIYTPDSPEGSNL